MDRTITITITEVPYTHWLVLEVNCDPLARRLAEIVLQGNSDRQAGRKLIPKVA